MVDEKIAQLFSQFAKASEGILLKSLERTRSYAEVVNDYRQLEAEFVARMGDNEFGVLETKRRIAESILSLAHDYNPSFEVCQEAWNDLVRLGFTNIERECMMAWFYADCCAYNEQPEEGLAVLGPLLAELERQREERRAAQRSTGFYDNKIEHLGDIQYELQAQLRGHLRRDRITRRIDEAYCPTPEEEKMDELHDELSNACLAVWKTISRSRDRSFADVAADYRRVEADIVARAGDGEAFQVFVLEVRQKIAGEILVAASMLEQPFEVCHEAWNDVVRLGFPRKWGQCWMTGIYASSCGFNGKPEEGLAVVEPLLAELQRDLDAELERRAAAREKGEPPTHEKPSPSYYRDWLKTLGELRDKLSAKRSGNEPST